MDDDNGHDETLYFKSFLINTVPARSLTVNIVGRHYSSEDEMNWQRSTWDMDTEDTGDCNKE